MVSVTVLGVGALSVNSSVTLCVPTSAFVTAVSGAVSVYEDASKVTQDGLETTAAEGFTPLSSVTFSVTESASPCAMESALGSLTATLGGSSTSRTLIVVVSVSTPPPSAAWLVIVRVTVDTPDGVNCTPEASESVAFTTVLRPLICTELVPFPLTADALTPPLTSVLMLSVPLSTPSVTVTEASSTSATDSPETLAV